MNQGLAVVAAITGDSPSDDSSNDVLLEARPGLQLLYSIDIVESYLLLVQFPV